MYKYSPKKAIIQTNNGLNISWSKSPATSLFQSPSNTPIKDEIKEIPPQKSTYIILILFILSNNDMIGIPIGGVQSYKIFTRLPILITCLLPKLTFLSS